MSVSMLVASFSDEDCTLAMSSMDAPEPSSTSAHGGQGDGEQRGEVGLQRA